MAYTAGQIKDIACEWARYRGVKTHVLKALREEYESFATFHENTLTLISKRKEFPALVMAQAAILDEAQCAATVEAERARARAEMQRTHIDRLAQDELLLDQARQNLEAELAKENMKPGEKIWAFDALAKIIDKRRAAVLPAVAETHEAECLVEAMMEAAVAEFGQGRARILTKKIRELYEQKIQAANAPQTRLLSISSNSCTCAAVTSRS